MKKFLRFSWILTFLLALFLTSCGGGGGQKAVIPSTTSALDDSTVQRLSSVSEGGSTLTFSETTTQLESLSPGDIISSGVSDVTPDGLLRKVISVSKMGDQLVAETTQATLEEAIEKGTIEVSKTLTPSDVSSAVASREGVTLEKTTIRWSPAVEAFYVQMRDVVLYDDDGDLKATDDQIKANGGILLSPSFDFDIKIDGFQLKQLLFTIKAKQTAQLELVAEASILEISERVELARYYFTPITVVVGVPPVLLPVVFTPVLTVNVGLDGEVSAGITTSATQKTTVTAGLSYDDGKWKPISDLSTDFEFKLPSLSASAGVKAYAGPQLSLMTYGVAGPFAEINGYLELDADAFPDWVLYGGLEANVGVESEIFSQLVAGYRATIIDYKKELVKLAKAETRPTPGTPTPAPSTPTLNPTALLLKAEENTLALDQAGFQTQLTYNVEGGGSSMHMDMHGSGTASGDFASVYFKTGSLNIDVSDPEMGWQKAEGRIADNVLSVREPSGQWQEVGSVEEAMARAGNPLGMFTAYHFADLLSQKIVTVEQLGEEMVEGTRCYHLRLCYDLSRPKELMSDTLLGMAGVGEATITKVDKFASDLWIGKKDVVIRKQSFDFAFSFTAAGMAVKTSASGFMLLVP